MQNAVKRLFDNYTDYYGRVCLYENTLSNPRELVYDSENQWLYTGIAGNMLRYHKFDMVRYKLNAKMVLDNTKIRPGLYARHPEPYVLNGGHSMSHDEHNGLCFISAALNAPFIAQELVEYGRAHHWGFIEESPYLDLIEYVKSNPLDEVKRLYKTVKNYLNGKGTHETEKSYLTRITTPETTILMRIVAGEKVGLVAKLVVALASELSGNKDKMTTSSKIMTFNKFLTFRLLGVKSKLVDFARNRFHKKMVKMYGENYYHEMIGIYYKDINHPFHELSNGMTLELK